MKAYKASDEQKCINITYEVGKTYTFNGEMELCERGFHFCKNAEDVILFYPIDRGFVLFEIEVLGPIIDDSITPKSVTDKFKVLRIIPKSEYNDFFTNRKFDERGNLIYTKEFANGEEIWFEYDEKDRCTEKKFNTGRIIKFEYNENDQIVHEYLSNGFEYWYEYDKNNNQTYYKCTRDNASSFEEWKTYDKNNMIYSTNSKGEEKFCKYNANNLLIYTKYYYGTEEWIEYNKDDIMISRKDSKGVEQYWEYDERGNEIHCVFSNAYERWRKYDINNNEIYFKSNNNECWYEYDENNKMISTTNKEAVISQEQTNENMADTKKTYVETYQKFDKNGNLIYYKNKDTEYSITIE